MIGYIGMIAGLFLGVIIALAAPENGGKAAFIAMFIVAGAFVVFWFVFGRCYKCGHIPRPAELYCAGCGARLTNDADQKDDAPGKAAAAAEAQMGDRDLTETQISSEEIFDGVVLHLFKDEVRLPNGNTSGREYLKHLGAVCVVKNILKNIGINERLANNLFIDFELNKPELESLIKKDLEQKFLDNDDILSNTNIKVDSNETINFKFTKFAELKSHFDVVRKLVYLENINSIISVSEDCLIKVWSFDNMMYNYQNENISPYLNLRGHTGPLFCVASGKDNLIYTGGNESLIRIWNILPYNEINSLQSNEELNKLNLGFFQDNVEKEIYWYLEHSPKDNLLVSLSSSGKITFWETSNAENYIHSFNQGKLNWYKSHILYSV